MKYIPILFSTPMVQAILEGRKTITRRLCGLDEVNEKPGNWKYLSNDLGFATFELIPSSDTWKLPYDAAIIKCPYGQPGDVIWVRENLRSIEQDYGPARFAYKTTETIDVKSKWKPSIHMPKGACRIFLKIRSVRAERLQDISQEQAKAEGVYPSPHRCEGWENPLLAFADCYKCTFKMLWNKINGAAGHQWDKNEWVWVIEFERIEKPVDFI